MRAPAPLMRRWDTLGLLGPGEHSPARALLMNFRIHERKKKTNLRRELFLASLDKHWTIPAPWRRHAMQMPSDLLLEQPATNIAHRDDMLAGLGALPLPRVPHKCFAGCLPAPAPRPR
jgi:hypothetical protein